MTKRNSILSKVKKMLALAGNTSNEHEATLAAAKAHEFLTMHNMCVEALSELTDEDVDIVEESIYDGTNLPSWRKWLVTGASRAFGCDVLITTRYVSGRRTRSLQLVGTTGDVQVASATIGYLADTINRLAETFTRGHGRRYANSFRLGATRRIVERLKERAEMNRAEAEAVSTGAGRELVLVKDANLADHMSQYRRSALPTVTLNREGYERGVNAANNVGLDPQVGNRPSDALGGE